MNELRTRNNTNDDHDKGIQNIFLKFKYLSKNRV